MRSPAGSTLGGLIPNVESAADRAGAAGRLRRRRRRHRGRDGGLRRRPGVRVQHARLAAAALSSPATGLAGSRKVGLIGYSGGAIATEWAAELAPTYAPDINRRLVGAAFGGVLVDPAHNLHYINGSTLWAGVMPMALIGIARAFHIDLTPYLSEYGLQLFDKLQRASIIEVLGAVPGPHLGRAGQAAVRRPPKASRSMSKLANQLIMGTRGTPTVPLLIAQGAGGELEGTSGDQPGIGAGDGVMVAGDVRSLAREYCERGVAVQYDQYDDLSHLGSRRAVAGECAAVAGSPLRRHVPAAGLLGNPRRQPAHADRIDRAPRSRPRTERRRRPLAAIEGTLRRVRIPPRAQRKRRDGADRHVARAQHLQRLTATGRTPILNAPIMIAATSGPGRISGTGLGSDLVIVSATRESARA